MPFARTAKQKAPETPISNFWMITFSDLLMLLLTFFVMLLTMKSMSHKDLREFFPNASIKGGPLEFSETGFTGNAPDFYGDNENALFVENAEAMKQVFTIMKDIPTALPNQEDAVKRLQEAILIKNDPKGVVVSFQTESLFEPGTAAMNPSRLEMLDAVGELLRMTTNKIIIMSYSGNADPRTTRLKSNWELTVYRALQVQYYLTDNLGMKENRMAVGGYGDKHLPEKEAEDRIEFVLMK